MWGNVRPIVPTGSQPLKTKLNTVKLVVDSSGSKTGLLGLTGATINHHIEDLCYKSYNNCRGQG